MEEAVKQLAKHKPVQSRYVSLLLPNTHRDHSTTNSQSPSSCQPNITDAPDPNNIIEDQVDMVRDLDHSGETENDIKEDRMVESNGELSKSPGSSQEDLSNGCTNEDAANDT